MSAKSFRSSLAAFLIAASIASLSPAVYAGQKSSDQPQRRGKNGVSTKQTDPPAAPISKELQAEEDSDRSKREDADSKTEKPTQKNPPAQAQKSQTTSTEQSGSSKTRREPPPFDRPPLQSSPQASDDSAAKSSQPPGPRPSQPTPQPADRDIADPPRDADRSESDRSTSQPPVLRRPPDSRNPSPRNEESSRPPVLRRPSDSRYPAPQPEPERDDTKARTSPGDDEPIRLDATLVNIPMLVSDRAGRYIPQLSKEDFILYEDGARQEIAFFGDEKVPFNVALLLDVSPSVQNNLEDIQDAAIEFVRQLRPGDRVMVVSFDRSVHFLTDFTSDRRQLEYAIRRTATGGGTSVYDAVYETVDRKLRGIEGRKALILFSDGEDTTSRRADYDDAVQIVTESDVLVYGLRYPGSGRTVTSPWPRNPVPQIPIPLPWPWPRKPRGPLTNIDMASPAQQRWPRRGINRDFMTDITEAGGGPVYDAERISDLGRLASRIAEELRHVYVVSYYPTNPLSNGGYRSIRIRVSGRDDIAVRHRRGYNAQDAKNRT